MRKGESGEKDQNTPQVCGLYLAKQGEDVLESDCLALVIGSFCQDILLQSEDAALVRVRYITQDVRFGQVLHSQGVEYFRGWHIVGAQYQPVDIGFRTGGTTRAKQTRHTTGIFL